MLATLRAQSIRVPVDGDFFPARKRSAGGVKVFSTGKRRGSRNRSPGFADQGDDVGTVNERAATEPNNPTL